MAAPLTPLTLTCPIRGIIKAPKRSSTDLGALEERHRIDAIRYLLSLGYDPSRIKIEAVVAKFGHGGKNSFRCDLAVLDVDASSVDVRGKTGVDDLLSHALILVEVKRDDKDLPNVTSTQVTPLLKFAPRKDTIGLYWDAIRPRVFWKEDEGGSRRIKDGPLALLPRPGEVINVKPLKYADLKMPPSLIDIFTRIENVLHAASVGLEARYEVILQLLLAKIFDEHEGASNPSENRMFQDFATLGVPPKIAAKQLNKALRAAVGFYEAHLPKSVEERFDLEEATLTNVGELIAPLLITAANKEVVQTFYMKFAKDLYRWDLAQYFTPPTVTDFIVEVLNPAYGETVKDPACGSADFLVASFHRSRSRKIKNAADMNHGADNDQKAVQIAVLNMLLNGDGKTNIHKADSLETVAQDKERSSREKRFKPLHYNILVCNPPFGVKIIEKRKQVLEWFDLAHVWDKNPQTGKWVRKAEVLKQQEKGLLFAEVCVNQTRPGGRIAIILPNGYLGNRSAKFESFREWLLRQCKVASICGFPRFTFKSSGADVSASVVFLEKRDKPLSDSAEDQSYMFNCELIENVGWTVSSKKPTVVYQRSASDGSYLVGEDGLRAVKSDFAAVLNDIRTSPINAQYTWLTQGLNLPPHGKGKLGWALSIEDVVRDPFRTLDPKRHSPKYRTLMQRIQQGKHVSLLDLTEVVQQGKSSSGQRTSRRDNVVYRYVDIDNMGAGEFQAKEMHGWELPLRGRHFAEPLDIYVGSIWSSVSKWCLMPEKLQNNTVVSNGCHRLRIKKGKEKFLPDLCAFFCSETYTTQMRALARGSDGLAEIHEQDLGDVLVPLIEEKEEKARLQPFISALLEGRATLKGTVGSMLEEGNLNMPLPPVRSHHSSLV